VEEAEAEVTLPTVVVSKTAKQTLTIVIAGLVPAIHGSAYEVTDYKA
jgi:hypothetical protein